MVQLCILLRILFRILCFEVLQSWLDMINSIKVIDIPALIPREECGERQALGRGEALLHPWAKYVSVGPPASRQICVCQNYLNFPERNSGDGLKRPFVKPISTSQWPQLRVFMTLSPASCDRNLVDGDNSHVLRIMNHEPGSELPNHDKMCKCGSWNGKVYTESWGGFQLVLTISWLTPHQMPCKHSGLLTRALCADDLGRH